MCDPATFPHNWQGFPNLRRHGNNEQYPYFTSACPYNGGTDRISIYPKGTRKDKYPGRGWMICRSCDMFKWIGERVTVGDRQKHVEAPARPLDPEVALRWHREINSLARDYFHGRGISDEMIVRHKLGWNYEMQRFSTPCWVDGRLWAIQYRITPAEEKQRKEAGQKVIRYLSESGGHNKQLFNSGVCNGRKVPAILVLEGPLDALAATSLGFPAVAPFQGNNAHRSWEPAWTKYLLSFSRLIVPDAKGGSSDELIALSKLNDIPLSRICNLPAGYGDVGEFIKADLATAQKRMAEWLGLPIVQVVYGRKDVSQVR